MKTELWQRWLRMARSSRQAAEMLVRSAQTRDAASRAYCSAYQAMTALLQYCGHMTPPVVDGVRRESWTHKDLPRMVQANAKRAIKTATQRNQMSSDLSRLYKLRTLADYVSGEHVDPTAAEKGCRDAGRLIKVVQDVTGDDGQ